MKILSLDVGDKTIGIAASDPLEMIATGIMTLERTNIKKNCDKIIDIVLRNEYKRIVITIESSEPANPDIPCLAYLKIGRAHV